MKAWRIPTTRVSPDVQTKRLGLLEQLDATFRKQMADENVRAYNDFYDTTLQLMKSSDLKAFDLSAEPAAMREKYGRNKFGQGCLLARRLVENGVRFVEVQSGGWDMHKQLEDSMEDRGAEFDRAFAALVADLDSRGLLDSTLVAVTTEFGRKPSFDGSRPRASSDRPSAPCSPAAAVKRGYVHGSSDAKGYAPDVEPDDRRRLPRHHRLGRGPADRAGIHHAERPADDRRQQGQAGDGRLCVGATEAIFRAASQTSRIATRGSLGTSSRSFIASPTQDSIAATGRECRRPLYSRPSAAPAARQVSTFGRRRNKTSFRAKPSR